MIKIQNSIELLNTVWESRDKRSTQAFKILRGMISNLVFYTQPTIQ